MSSEKLRSSQSTRKQHTIIQQYINASGEIPGTAEPGGLLSMGSHRVGDSWSDLAAAAAADSLEMQVPGQLLIYLRQTVWNKIPGDPRVV